LITSTVAPPRKPTGWTRCWGANHWPSATSCWLVEVLQGFRREADYQTARSLLLSLTVFEMLGVSYALRSAENYRRLRRQGIPIRKTIDVIIATYCIEEGHALLFSDRDFLPFVEHLGLQMVV